jgi:anti-sigma B factor antagonist
MFESAVTFIDGHAVVHFSGELDATEADTALAVTIGVIEAGHPHVVIDLSDLRFICSAGASVLLASNRAAKAAGGSLVVRHPTARVEQVFHLLALSKALDIRYRPSIERAS